MTELLFELTMKKLDDNHVALITDIADDKAEIVAAMSTAFENALIANDPGTVRAFEILMSVCKTVEMDMPDIGRTTTKKYKR